MMEFNNGIDIAAVVGNVWYVVLGFIAFDVVTGLLAAGKEKKLNSSINYVGLIRKVGELAAVAFFVFIDAYLGANEQIVKIGVGMVIVYEVLSIVENFSRIGLNLNFVTKFFDSNKVGKGDK
ncbi:phage holin family protein [Ornithinibacillus scapharcae]|uniref:phage holin family protein n=1 Tax=Ornithinibacillus scapharcae TaxID=1147159 RepID=UPI000225C19C|nr:phage holin family protein [Ornithinibacillus scapharcae]